MTSLDPILPKLEKLVPRLSSDADGEVVATVRAIDRALRGAGCDWHDLTAALAPPRLSDRRSAPEPRPKSQRPRTWHEIAEWCAMRAMSRTGALDTKELSFVCDMARLLRRRAPSDKKAKWLKSIYEKLGGVQ